MRCLGSRCVVSNNSSSTLSSIFWDGSTTVPTIVDAAIPVGLYPWNLGVIEASDGSMLIGSVHSDYSTNPYSYSYNIVKLDTSGNAISNNSYPLTSCGYPVDIQFVNETTVAIVCDLEKSIQILSVGASAPAP